jgi:hypothetical protein
MCAMHPFSVMPVVEATCRVTLSKQGLGLGAVSREGPSYPTFTDGT